MILEAVSGRSELIVVKGMCGRRPLRGQAGGETNGRAAAPLSTAKIDR